MVSEELCKARYDELDARARRIESIIRRNQQRAKIYHAAIRRFCETNQEDVDPSSLLKDLGGVDCFLL